MLKVFSQAGEGDPFPDGAAPKREAEQEKGGIFRCAEWSQSGVAAQGEQPSHLHLGCVPKPCSLPFAQTSLNCGQNEPW